jgi:hypothetical protein
MVPGPATRAVPSKVDWLHTEMLKTRVAHGFGARHPAAGAARWCLPWLAVLPRR